MTSTATAVVEALPPPIDLTVNNIGIQGAAMFGVGITDNLPLGMSEMTGTRTVGHENYGNYQHTDGSIMCWIPQFFYRWGGADSPRATKYGLNSLDVKSKHDFTDVAAANAAGYAVHRAFYDDGKLKDGFFVDKYQASNNAGIASSIKNGIPLSSSASNAPFNGLNGKPANTLAGAINAAKTRGAAFFVTTLFVQRALSLLSMAHGQAATNTTDCAWYNVAGTTNFPKGCNNNALKDVNDATVKYTATGFQNAGKTGSALPFAKTTHNGQANGVADLNGNMYEICIGVTQRSSTFYALKTAAKAAEITSGTTLSTDAWGASSMAANYSSLGAGIGALEGGAARTLLMGNKTNQVFSNASSGAEWQASCAGIPLSTGVHLTTGTSLFGSDNFIDDTVADVCPVVGGAWYDMAGAGVWHTSFIFPQTFSDYGFGFRSALYGV